MSDVPALGELARRATDVIEAKAAVDAIHATLWHTEAFKVAADKLDYAERRFVWYAPAVILQLVALATGEADTELLDGLLDDALSEMREPMTLADARNVRDMLTRVQVERKKAKVRAARSLTPERPADGK